jgi:hypothetical protein
MPTSWDGCADITVALDDLLTARVTACALCGARDRQQGVWPVQMQGRMVGVSYGMCQRCGQDQAQFHQRLQTLLTTRYSTDRIQEGGDSYGERIE